MAVFARPFLRFFDVTYSRRPLALLPQLNFLHPIGFDLHLMHIRPLSHLTTLTLVPLLAYLQQVRAHGYVAKVVIDGTAYSGNVPNAEPTPSIVRQINTIDPVKGASNSYLNCGQDAQKAALVANANPGSQLQFLWLDGDGTHVRLVFHVVFGEEIGLDVACSGHMISVLS